MLQFSSLFTICMKTYQMLMYLNKKRLMFIVSYHNIFLIEKANQSKPYFGYNWRIMSMKYLRRIQDKTITLDKYSKILSFRTRALSPPVIQNSEIADGATFDSKL